MYFAFSDELATADAEELIALLRGPRLWVPKQNYPDSLDWAERAYSQFMAGTKWAIVARSKSAIVGAVVYQPHRSIEGALELKNLTVDPDIRERHVASFLVRNAEVEGKARFGSTHVICDAKRDNNAIRSFLHGAGYSSIGDADLYNLRSGIDTIYRKSLLVRTPRT